MNAGQIFILCEGLHDRAFWKGVLSFLGCTSLSGPALPLPVDPSGFSVRGGQNAFQGRQGGFIRVVLAHGRRGLLEGAKVLLKGRAGSKRLRCLILNSDAEENADGTPSGHGELQFKTLLQLARTFDPQARRAAEHVISLDANTRRIIAFPWRSTAPPTPGVPHQQSLERLICGALAAVHKDRPAHLEAWLKSWPAPAPPHPREHAFSHLTRWFVEHDRYEAFCESLWNDPQIAAELRDQLERQGVWTLIEEIAEIR